jgi:type II secretory pathway component PulC
MGFAVWLAVVTTAVRTACVSGAAILRYARGAPLAAVLRLEPYVPASHQIERSDLFGHLNELSRSARIVPEIRAGRAAGLRVYSVRAGGPAAQIGLQNGDVLRAIDGVPLDSPEKALECYARLKTAHHVSVLIERNGQPVTLEYDIR